MVEKGLYELLTNDAGVSALVGSSVYFILAPKGTTLPFIVISRVATNDSYDMVGATGFRGGLFQFDCYATDFYSSRAISLAVRRLLESYQGNLPDADATPVSAVLTEKDWDMPYEEGGKGFVYRALLEFRIFFYDTTLPVNTPASGGEAVIDGGTN
jgi:hypothetical protein